MCTMLGLTSANHYVICYRPTLLHFFYCYVYIFKQVIFIYATGTLKLLPVLLFEKCSSYILINSICCVHSLVCQQCEIKIMV